MRFATLLALVASLGLASPSLPAATWPPAVASCEPDAASNPYQCPQGDPALVEMFAKARAHDVAGVERASARVKTSAPGRDGGIEPDSAKLAHAFALDLANPAAYETAYLQAFLHNSFAGYHLLSTINLVGLAPNPFESITRRAAAGDGLAYAAILGAVAPLNDFHAFDNDAWAIGHSGAKLFAAMVAAGPAPVAFYLCTEQDEGRDPGSAQRMVAKLKATTPKGRALLAKLKAMIANCNAYDANF